MTEELNDYRTKHKGCELDKIPDIEWKISETGHSYHRESTVALGLPQDHGLTKDEFDTLIVDIISHEVIHHILEHIFSEAVTSLFDAIGDKLREDPNVLRRVIQRISPEDILWCDLIEKCGIQGLFNSYWMVDGMRQAIKDGC